MKTEKDAEGQQADSKPEARFKAALEDVQAAERREKNWHEVAKKVVDLYEAEFKKDYQFNVLYSNTETLAPALYSTTPKPNVQRRFKDEDPIGGEASKVLQRALEFLIDDGNSVYARYDDLMNAAVLDGLVPGRGVTRFKYDVTYGSAEKGEIQISNERTLPGAEKETAQKVEWEMVCGEFVPWDRFGHGYGRTWQEVPFVFYKWPMTRAELVKNFGADIGNEVKLDALSSKEVDGTKTRTDADLAKELKAAWVYEIWYKETKDVVFISEGYQLGPLKVVEDPLKLTGFFDCAEPLKFFNRVSGLTPQTLYAFYEEQAKELNSITFRINRIIKALKVRGIYDGSITEFQQVFAGDDNLLLPADNTAKMYDNGGLDKAIWMIPIDKLVLVLQQLYIARESCKQVIYEVTGISDIIRGTSNPNETLGAQKIKDQWGNLRLRRLQKRVQAYCVDCLRIMAEIACTHFDQETFAGMTNLKYPTNADKEKASQAVQAMQAQAAQGGQVDPSMAQPLMEVLSKPSWEEIMGVLQNDLQRCYRIDIESNSTIEPEATEDKESMMGLLNALSQFLLGVQPLVADGSLPFEAMKAILMTICRRFNFGAQVEDELKKMQPPQSNGQDPEEAKKQMAEIEKQKADLEKQMQELEKAKGAFELQTQQDRGQISIEQQKAEASIKLMFDEKKAELELEIKLATADLNAKRMENEMMLKSQHQANVMDLQMKTSEASLMLRDETANLSHGLKDQEREIDSKAEAAKEVKKGKEE
jgi:hypothetical protein